MYEDSCLLANLILICSVMNGYPLYNAAIVIQISLDFIP